MVESPRPPRARPSRVSRMRVIRRPSSLVSSTSPCHSSPSPVARCSTLRSRALRGLRSSCEALSANSCCLVITRSISSAMPLNTCAMRRSSGGPSSAATRASISPRSIATMASSSRRTGESTQRASRKTRSTPSAMSTPAIAEMSRSWCRIAARGAATSPATSTAPITSPSSNTGSANAESETLHGNTTVGCSARRPESASLTRSVSSSRSTAGS